MGATAVLLVEDDFKSVAQPERQDVLDQQLALRDAGVRRAVDEGRGVRAALTADPQGNG